MAAQHPARQLNSKSIKDAIVSYVVPAVQKRFCIVSVNCVWRVQGNSESMTKAWDLICEKRSECDSAITNVPGVAFFFSAISSKENNPSSKGKKSSEDTDAIDEEEIDEDISSQRTISSDTSRCSAINTAVEKNRLPAVSYWIAFESTNGAPISLVQLHRNLIECEVEIDTKIVTYRTGSSTEMIKKLCVVLKDHSSSYINDIVNGSFEACYLEAMQQLECGSGQLEDDEEVLKERPLRFVVLKHIYMKEIKGMINALVRAGLQLDVDGLDDSCIGIDTGSTSTKALTTDQCTQLINEIEILMTKLGYAIHQGTVFRKNSRAKYTYTYKCEVSAFIGE